MKRFLITGFPRIRSAWLAALFSSDRVRCFHDMAQYGSVENLLQRVSDSNAEVTGLIDPGAAMIYPREAMELFSGHTVVIVRRNQEESKRSIERWAGIEMAAWDDGLRNYTWLVQGPFDGLNKFQWVDYADLDNFDVVNWLHLTCTGAPLDRHRFELFNYLKIEQHIGKAVNALLRRS